MGETTMTERPRCPECGQPLPPPQAEIDRRIEQAERDMQERRAARLAREQAAEAAQAQAPA